MWHIGNVGNGIFWPMHAAREFAEALVANGLLERTWRVRCLLHRTPRLVGRDPEVEAAVMRGLEAADAGRPDLATVARPPRRIRDARELSVMGTRRITFDRRHHFTYVTDHGTHVRSGSMRLCLTAYDPGAAVLLQRSYEGPQTDHLLLHDRKAMRGHPVIQAWAPAAC